MKNPSKIAHPLKTRRGTSQQTRLIEALQPESAPIDGKTLADRLYLICEYARHIKFHEIAEHEQEGEYQAVDNWHSFFSDSLPFQLAKLSKLSVSDLEQQFLLLHKELIAHPSRQSLESLVEFIYDKLILPNHQLYQAVALSKNSFKVPLLATLESSFKEPLKCFIALYNAGVTYLCLRKKDFMLFLDAPWLLGIDDIYTKDSCIQNVKKGKKEAYLLAADSLNIIFNQLIIGLQEITANAPQFIQESLRPLKESLKQKHKAHLALLFTFLELFNHFQGDINSLSEKHLDFFYREVLKMIPRKAVPDKAHLVFEVAKHLDAHPLKKGLLFKDGKDENKQDIQFALDHELIIDKAQIQDLRTLFLNPVTDGTNNFTEGVYMAPLANSADGLGKKFKKDAPNNWPTLGSKYSKCIQEGELVAEEHPKARLGFVLSSPVLLLQEGTRDITILLDCEVPAENGFDAAAVAQFLDDLKSKLEIDATKTVYYITEKLLQDCELSLAAKTYLTQLLVRQNPYEIQEKDLETFLDIKDPVSCLSIFSNDDREELKKCLADLELATKVVDNSLFKLWFSGEEEWIPGSPTVTISKLSTGGPDPKDYIQFELTVTLNPEDPAVVFYNEEILQENLDLKDCFPLVKIELNEDVKINCEPEPNEEENCCLKKRFGQQDLWISPYHFLKRLQLVNAKIDVEVCGVKNLIVQNEENIQDVSKIMFPFGPRPKINASFYIGSKEIFCKDWIDFRLKVQWKDRPADFNEYYEAYNQDSTTPEIFDNSFIIRGSVLENQLWVIDNTKELFTFKENFHNCPAIDDTDYENGYTWLRNSFGTSADDYEPKSMPKGDLTPLDVNSRKAFFRIQLEGEDFQHDRYAFVLAQQMFKLADVADLIQVQDFVDKIIENHDLAFENLIRLNALITEVTNEGGEGGTINAEMINQIFGINNPFPIPDEDGLDEVSVDLHNVAHELEDDINDIVNGAGPPILPNEPYTPMIKSIALDYTAQAEVDDMEIVHLYPFEKTSKGEDIEQNPYLFPYFDDEGTLFIGIEEITPGGNLSLLFQLAEATADSEQNRAEIEWSYLSNNEWIELRQDFEVIADGTDGLTVSGIINIAVPDAISKIGNTVMPDEFYWIKVAAPKNVLGVAETIGIHTQAGKSSAKINALHDLSRLETELKAGSIAKLVEGDFSVKKVLQPYASLGGRKPEVAGHFYTRVSEHLKHKGRGQLLLDYEKIVLEGFPEIYKAKCISHSMGLSANEYRRDLEIAPGFVILSVIPDLNKLKAGNTLKPKAPVSLLEKIGDHLRRKISPFARLKVMNPRYEYVDVCVAVRLYRGKPQNFYANKLKEDIALFLAPWFVGDMDKLAFGQEVFFSDVVGFIEGLDYVDYIVELKLEGQCEQNGQVIKPLTARSILTAGEICVNIDPEECPEPITSDDLQN